MRLTKPAKELNKLFNEFVAHHKSIGTDHLDVYGSTALDKIDQEERRTVFTYYRTVCGHPTPDTFFHATFIVVESDLNNPYCHYNTPMEDSDEQRNLSIEEFRELVNLK